MQKKHMAPETSNCSGEYSLSTAPPAPIVDTSVCAAPQESSPGEGKSPLENIFSAFSFCPVKGCPLNFASTHAICIYSNILFCLGAKHAGSPSSECSLPFREICNFERAVLLAVQIDRTFKPAPVGRLDLNCEQDIESLAFKIYEQMPESRRRAMGPGDYYCILDMLHCRGEFERFFGVYDECSCPNLGVYKLALVASLHADNGKEMRIFLRLKNALGLKKDVDPSRPAPKIDKKYAKLVEEAAEGGDLPACSASDAVTLFYTVRAWYMGKYKEFHWTAYMNKWYVSKSTEGASEAMLDKCIRFKKYEEGWCIYKETALEKITPLRLLRLSNRALFLIMQAINNSNANMWAERYLEVATVISRLNITDRVKIHSTFAVLLNLKNYNKMSYLACLVLKQYPDPLLNNNASICMIFGVIYEMFKKYEYIFADKSPVTHLENNPLTEIERTLNKNDVLLPELAVEACLIYRKWRKSHSRGVFFSLFWGRSHDSMCVYNSVLQIAIIVKAREEILSICSDMWNDSIPVTEDVSSSLVYIHRVFTECACSESENACTRPYLMHVLSLLEAAPSR
ncbi:uncharacterized protein NEMAJ01_0823 [Nematocida major]|uniref:uncharacterized protein n=1 Tax=Nematocida major TaxID=1912982 RepID=UPI0020088548|nr:uncharacterized protein NEMAJ01_0823 [Nematocida major]KAH9385927.1 hypothetical protein NEMAJ01_0823 [Nematocida major]